MYRAPTGDASCAGHRASRPALWPSNSSPQRALVNRQGVADESVVRWRPGGGQALANGDVQAGYGAAKPARDQGTDARGNGGGNCTRRTARVIHDVDAAPASSTPLRTCGPLGPTWIRTRDLGAMLPGDRPLVHTKRAQGKGEDEGEGEAEESERADEACSRKGGRRRGGRGGGKRAGGSEGYAAQRVTSNTLGQGRLALAASMRQVKSTTKPGRFFSTTTGAPATNPRPSP